MDAHQKRLQYLDTTTVVIAQLAHEFNVTWHVASLRGVSLGLWTMQDLEDIKDLAQQEAVATLLAKP